MHRRKFAHAARACDSTAPGRAYPALCAPNDGFVRVLDHSEVGCALAHRNVYDRVVAESLPCALVLEDDATPTPDFVSALRGLHMPRDGFWDVIKLDNTANLSPDRGMAGCVSTPGPTGVDLAMASATASAMASMTTPRTERGGGCVVYHGLHSLQGARTLRRLQEPLWLAADEVFNEARAATVLEPLGMSLATYRALPHSLYQNSTAPCERARARACDEAH